MNLPLLHCLKDAKLVVHWSFTKNGKQNAVAQLMIVYLWLMILDAKYSWVPTKD
jgi:hypothetical protein